MTANPLDPGRMEELWRQHIEKQENKILDNLDPVNHPAHYTNHPSGVECITITQHMGFCLGNAIKYIWRADLKGNAVEDLKKARFYIDQEIALREKKAD